MARLIKPIQILGNFQRGIASHPLNGIGMLRNIDVKSNPGSAKLNLKTAASASTISGQMTWIVGVGILYGVDDTNKVYKSSDSGQTWTVIGNGSNGSGQNGLGAGQGLAIWKNYLFAIGAGVDVYGPLDSSPVWTKGWVFSLSYANFPSFCPAFASIDGCLYIGNGNKVHKVQEATAPFEPGTSGSYTATTAAITLASQYNVTQIQDLGSQLALGTKISIISNVAFTKAADIFPYDRSTLTLGIPVKIPEGDIQQMISVSNRLFFFAGLMGKFYESDLNSYSQVAEIPNYVYQQNSNNLFFYPGAIMFLDGKIFFGLGGGGGATVNNMGVWSYNILTRALLLENIISTGRDATAASLYVSSLMPLSGKNFVMGWRDVANSTQYGVDYMDTNRYQTYSGYMESELVNVGEAGNFTQVGFIHINLLKPLVSGQGVKIKWRKDLTSSWTTLATVDFATYGGIQAFKIPAMSLKNLIFLQIRAELTTTDTTSPELVSVVVYPHEYEIG